MEPFSVDRDDVSVLIPSTLSLVEQALEIRVNKKRTAANAVFSTSCVQKSIGKVAQATFPRTFFRVAQIA